jgi:hypothetical protein
VSPGHFVLQAILAACTSPRVVVDVRATTGVYARAPHGTLCFPTWWQAYGGKADAAARASYDQARRMCMAAAQKRGVEAVTAAGAQAKCLHAAIDWGVAAPRRTAASEAGCVPYAHKTDCRANTERTTSAKWLRVRLYEYVGAEPREAHVREAYFRSSGDLTAGSVAVLCEAVFADYESDLRSFTYRCDEDAECDGV